MDQSGQPSTHDDGEQGPGPDEDGTFVGGDFGHGDNTEDGHLTTAQRLAAEREQEAHLADPDQSSATTQEHLGDPTGMESAGTGTASAATDDERFVDDVEGLGTEPSPGNEPV